MEVKEVPTEIRHQFTLTMDEVNSLFLFMDCMVANGFNMTSEAMSAKGGKYIFRPTPGSMTTAETFRNLLFRVIHG